MISTAADPEGTTRTPGASLVVALAIGSAAGFLLCGYELIRSASTSLFIGAHGAGRLPYAMVAGTALTIVLLYGYGRLLTLTGPRRTLLFASLLSGVAIVVLYPATRCGCVAIPTAAYALREAYIVILVEQYWSFINSVFRERQAKRLTGLICGIASLGAVVGGYATRWLADGGGRWQMGTDALLLLAGCSLLPAALCSDLAYRIVGEPDHPVRPDAPREALALRLFAESSVLRRIGLLILLTQVVSTALDLAFFGVVEHALPLKDARTAFIGQFYGRLNLVAAVLQFVAVPVLLSLVPLHRLHAAIPLLHIGAAVALLANPSLLTAGLAFMAFKALDYSLFRAGKELFYMPLSFDSRYRAKEVIDAFGYRAAKGISAGAAALARATLGALPVAAYPFTVLCAATGWLWTVVGLARQHEAAAPRA